MTTYTAWDGNEYPLPTPEGWYLGTDDRWWPEGHGPGPALAVPPALSGSPAPTEPGSGLPSAAPPMGAATDWSTSSDQTIYSAPPAGSGDLNAFAASAPSDDGGGNGKALLFLGLGLVALLGIGAAAFVLLGSGDSDEATTATTVFQTQQSDVEDAPATTAAPLDDTTETAPPVAGKGSVDDPYAVGEVIVVQYNDASSGQQRTWNLEVLAPASDITQAVLDENQFNDPPEGDQQFMAAPVRVTYVSGPAPASLFELTFKAVGPSGTVLTTFDPSCGVIPDALDTFAELFEGGSVEGNICWPASPADAGSLTMFVEVFLEDTEIYASLGG